MRKREEILLEQLPDEVIESKEFKKGITRRVLSRVCAHIMTALVICLEFSTAQ